MTCARRASSSASTAKCGYNSSYPGGGIKGKLNGQSIVLGKQKFIEDQKINIPEDLRNKSAQLQAKAQTVVWVAVDQKVIGVLGIADPIKKTTPEAIEEQTKIAVGHQVRTKKALAA